MLEKALESMGNTFLELSDEMLRSEQVQKSHQLVYSIQNATQRVLETAKEAVHSDEEEGVDSDSFKKEGEAEDSEPSAEELITSESSHYRMDLPIRSPSSMGLQHNRLSDYPQPISYEYINNNTSISPDQTQISTAQPLTGPILSSTFLSREFWTADYSNYTSVLPGDNLPAHLTFWQRLLRISVKTSYHALRGDPGYPTQRVKAQFRFSVNVRPVGFILASARRVLRQADSYDRSVAPDVPIERFFDDEPARAFGRDSKAEMIRLGERPDDYIDASEVADYLDKKGKFYYDGEVMKMALTVPALSREEAATGKPIKKIVVKIDVRGLIERLTWAAICMGDMVGYPKAKLNAAIVASVVTMAV